MLNTNDFLVRAHEHAVRFKTERVRAEGAKAGWALIVVANRGSKHVATFFPTNRDPLLWTMRLAVGAFGCDLVAGTVDAYQVVAEMKDGKPVPGASNMAGRNPDTGKPWGPGDMERAFKKGRPWVNEVLLTHAIEETRQTITTQMPTEDALCGYKQCPRPSRRLAQRQGPRSLRDCGQRSSSECNEDQDRDRGQAGSPVLAASRGRGTA